jgi:hypothetical protein
MVKVKFKKNKKLRPKGWFSSRLLLRSLYKCINSTLYKHPRNPTLMTYLGRSLVFEHPLLLCIICCIHWMPSLFLFLEIIHDKTTTSQCEMNKAIEHPTVYRYAMCSRAPVLPVEEILTYSVRAHRDIFRRQGQHTFIWFSSSGDD